MTFENVIKKFSTRGLRLEDVRRYLDAGGDIRHRDESMEWSLVHFAAEDCNTEVIRLLAAHGADLDAADRNGWTPLHIATDGEMVIPSQDGRRATELPTVQTLIELGADETIKAANGATPRDIAMHYGEQALYDSLLRPRAV